MKITDDMLTEEGLRKLLSDVWNLGQTYWRQADSEFASDNRRSDDTYKKYRAIVDESCERLADAARRTTPNREAISGMPWRSAILWRPLFAISTTASITGRIAESRMHRAMLTTCREFGILTTVRKLKRNAHGALLGMRLEPPSRNDREKDRETPDESRA
ncbi:hypothetical protein [Burkholderia thailandensis]|uniref:hypothetical protein n=1 Tax=Burkholderia thailandensis TaxID=57975 RepID=UPI001185299D|nr:hypothetical protein [Burkholderia thailandensis]